MNVIRSLARLTPGSRRLLLAAPIALAIITGLLFMHVLTGSHQPTLAFEGSTMGAHNQVAAAPAATDGVVMSATAEGDDCRDGCGTPAGMPDHSVLMTVCVLALLAAATLLFTPALRALFTRAITRTRSHTLPLVAGLPHPRPPSLLSLSISRT
ncbi:MULTISPECIES: DUF6153 family protein [Microbacterium]|uniref:Uncharacterized protein n=1 Tax=Microbacterium saccharophilum TaxID=1213358 RepID=A0A7Z7GDE7_9MICO|nr:MULTISPECIES: DUF6153 family protein [Microbacterium]SFI46617.1 hypothetical protein SAMN04487751_1726 [Microbacterium saccharophilum]